MWNVTIEYKLDKTVALTAIFFSVHDLKIYIQYFHTKYEMPQSKDIYKAPVYSFYNMTLKLTLINEKYF